MLRSNSSPNCIETHNNNDDENIDILDLVVVISHILGEIVLEGGAFYSADMNSNGIINIQDIILLINLILDLIR